MSEKTLQDVGEEAKALYAAHGARAHELPIATVHQKIANEKSFPYGPYADKADAEMVTDRINSEFDGTVKNGAEFAAANADKLHDLALLEAHIGGVAINVEEPVVVGQKVDVHTPEKL
jgi:predicted trehalose synthase